MNADLYLLFKATIRIYKNAFRDAFLGLIKNWKYLVFQYLVLFLTYLLVIFTSLLGGLVGSFLNAIILSLLISSYMASSLAVFNNENRDFKNLFFDGLNLFSPVINIFFCFFLINILFANLPSSNPFSLFINLTIAVLLNPVAEVIQLKPGGIMDMLRESFEFIRDNIVEWFMPAALFLFALYLLNPIMAKAVFYTISTENPLRFMELLFFNLLKIMLNTAIILVLMLVFYLSLFRLYLFNSLSMSTRRKRIYSERNQ